MRTPAVEAATTRMDPSESMPIGIAPVGRLVTTNGAAGLLTFTTTTPTGFTQR